MLRPKTPFPKSQESGTNSPDSLSSASPRIGRTLLGPNIKSRFGLEKKESPAVLSSSDAADLIDWRSSAERLELIERPKSAQDQGYGQGRYNFSGVPRPPPKPASARISALRNPKDENNNITWTLPTEDDLLKKYGRAPFSPPSTAETFDPSPRKISTPTKSAKVYPRAGGQKKKMTKKNLQQGSVDPKSKPQGLEYQSGLIYENDWNINAKSESSEAERPAKLVKSDIRQPPAWLVMAAQRDEELEQLAAGIIPSDMTINQISLPSPKQSPTTLTSTVNSAKFKTNTTMANKAKPSIATVYANPKSLASRTSKKAPIPPETATTEITTTISTRSKVKPKFQATYPGLKRQLTEAKLSLAMGVKDGAEKPQTTAIPSRLISKRFQDLGVKSSVSVDSFIPGAAGFKTVKPSKKSIKGKVKKGNEGGKAKKHSDTPLSRTDEFFASQHTLINTQLKNLCARQKNLENEVRDLLEGLQSIFEEKARVAEDKDHIGCCCNADTQTKMKAVLQLQKQMEVIQMQMDMKKRYGPSPAAVAPRSATHGPLLDGFNAHFSQLIPYVREIGGKLAYYCAPCNVACDNELEFRNHIESSIHIVKTCKAIKSTQPTFTCDDCGYKAKGTTNYMTHVISSNVHKYDDNNSQSEEET